LQFALIVPVFGQRDAHSISLDNYSVFTDTIPMRFRSVVDARREGNAIGFVQIGLMNKKMLAVLAKPGLQEITALLSRSNLIDNQSSVVMRVSRIHVSEIVKKLEERSKAEVNLDFFVELNGLYYFMGSEYGTSEDSGLETTDTHPRNIVVAFEQAILRFWQRPLNADDSIGYSAEEVKDPEMIFRRASDIPIVNAMKYVDGFYRSFDEFINNSPSIALKCKIKVGGEKAIVRCGDDEDESIDGVYGLAHNNVLYLYFHDNFFPLEKRRDCFYFTGPKVWGDTSRQTNAWIIGGAIGAMIAESSMYNTVYKLDPVTGVIHAVNGL
jgi:hypothetical protein